MLTFRGAQSTRAFHNILVVISTIMTAILVLRLCTNISFASPSLMRLALARTSTLAIARVVSNAEGA